MDFETISRRESRKRRRLSERRRLFSNSLGQQQSSKMSSINNSAASRSGSIGMQQDNGSDFYTTSRSESPIGGDQQRITMKIQFHMTVAPDNEPLILDNNHTNALVVSSLRQQPDSPTTTTKPPPTTTTTLPSIGDQIQEKLNISRQNSIASKNGGSTRRRQQQQRLVAMHKSTTTGDSANYYMDTPSSPDDQRMNDDPMAAAAQSDDNLLVNHRRDSRKVSSNSNVVGHTLPPVNGGSGGAAGGQEIAGREVGARSSTITDGMADEATVQFLKKTGDHHQRPSLIALDSTTPQRYNSAANLSSTSSPAGAATPPAASGNKATGIGSAKERIYFKRDGQRFGHEFTLKLAVDRTYRCLLKVRPLIPLQSISIQGHQLLFVDCSQQPTTGIGSGSGGGGGGGSAPSSTNSSTIALNHHQQRLRSDSANAVAVPATRHLSQPVNDAYLNKHHHLRNNNNNNHQHNNHHHHNHNHHHHHNHHHQNHHHQANHLRSHPMNNSGSGSGNKPGLYHAQTTGSLATTAPRASLDRSSSPYSAKLIHLAESTSLYCQQQNQMMRHFAASYCSSSNSHLGNQLIYMFDWPASRFEVNKNKNRTQIQTVLKFKNGQILSLPLQVKFYQSDCRQHLEWGSQLHFIDYDCQINQLGQISVDRTQYY